MINPLIPILKTSLHLSTSAISLLAGIPLLCFAATSLLMGFVAKLGSSNRIVTWALALLSLSLLGRAFTGVPGLFIFSIGMGVAIAILNYVLPVWVKEHAPAESGLFTGVYVTCMGLMASLAVAISVPLAHQSQRYSWSHNLGWRAGMLPWISLAGLSTIFWRFRMRQGESAAHIESVHFWHHRVFRQPVAWALTFFFGIQSVVFYATATWMPTILTTKHFTLSGAGIAVSITGMIGSAVGVVGPNYAAKRHDLRWFLIGVSLLSTTSYLMCIPSHGGLMYLWLALGNIGLSLSFPLALMLTVLKASSPEVTKSLSIMMQSFGYLLAALGPGFVGFLHDAFGSWGAGLAGVVALSFIQIFLGSIIGKPGQIA